MVYIITAHFEISDYIYNSLDSHEITYLVQMDIAKAYDTVSPKLMLQKLINELNPDCSTINLIRSYLFDRQVTTCANNCLSPYKIVNIGIPQGGVLPPLLFAFFLSDIKSLHLEGYPVMYADDLQVLYSCQPNQISSLEGKIRGDLDKVENFMKMLQMKLNTAKTTITKFGNNQQLRKFKHDAITISNGVPTKILTEVRNLGLIYDEGMTFRNHFETLSRNCSQLLYNIRCIRPYIEPKIALLLVEAFVVSRIRTYAPIIGTANAKNLQLLQKTINNAVRVVYNLRKFDHVSSFCARVQWGNIKKLAGDTFADMLQKVLQGRSSVYLTGLIERSSHNLTRRQFYINDRSNTNSGQRKFKHRAAVTLNRNM